MITTKRFFKSQETKEIMRSIIELLEFLGENVTEFKEAFLKTYGEELK